MVLNTAAISAVYTFSISFLIFLTGGGFAKMREKKLETEAAEDMEDEEDK